MNMMVQRKSRSMLRELGRRLGSPQPMLSGQVPMYIRMNLGWGVIVNEH
jgi:hypothetical protein